MVRTVDVLGLDYQIVFSVLGSEKCQYRVPLFESRILSAVDTYGHQSSLLQKGKTGGYG